MKKLILPFVLGAMMVSCSRDNDDAGLTPNPNNPTTPAETPVLLTKVVNTEEDGSIETTHFEYDGDKLVKTYGGYDNGSWSHENIITYKEGLITFIKNKEGDEEGETTYTYDSQNRLKTVIETSKDDERVYTSTRNYTHNADGTVVVKESQKTDYINPTHTDTEEEKIITYTVENGLIKKEETNNKGFIYAHTYTYDDKNAPLKNIRGIKPLIFEFFGDGSVSVMANNITSSTLDGYVETYTYDYNDKGYPKKMIATDNHTTDKDTYEYFYNK